MVMSKDGMGALALKVLSVWIVPTMAADVITKGHSNEISVLCAICKRPT